MKRINLKVVLFTLLLTTSLLGCQDEPVDGNFSIDDFQLTTNKSNFLDSDTISLLFENNSVFDIAVGKRCNQWLEMAYQEKKGEKWSEDKYFQYMYLKCPTFPDTVRAKSEALFLLPCSFFESTNIFRLNVPCYISGKDTSIVVTSNSFEVNRFE